MKVLIADKFEQSGRDGLDAAGCDYSYQPDVKDDALTEAIRNYQPDALVVRSTKVSEPMLDAGMLKLIVRAGAGYNTIDVAAASRRGIYVSNCPGKNSIAVAELAFALILALDRRIADNVITLRQGQWNKKEFSKARGLFGRTLGLVGTGQIGQEMITRARAFGLAVVAWSRSLTPERAEELGIERADSPLDVARAVEVRLPRDVVRELTRAARGFRGVNVESCAYVLLAHRAAEGLLVNDLAARGVDEVRAFSHRVEEVGANESARFGF
ncbi:MAG TPA: NAD(P)-dependent oxidoreductase, partial [Pyrinomonadaceae bacterium]|nr:NAD(P)-dependent oxidoreductase [Pyrinomonadaceae bacterium]